VTDPRGIASVSVVSETNCTVDIPAFTAGVTSVVCTATKINQTIPAQFSLESFSVQPETCGAITDPVFTSLGLSAGSVVKQTFGALLPAEHFIAVQNGTPGLRRLAIEINGEKFRTLSLREGSSYNIDAGDAMTTADNIVTLTGYGTPGDSAEIDITNMAPQAGGSAGPTGRPVIGDPGVSPVRSRRSRLNAAWGRLSEEVEDTTERAVVNLFSQTVQVAFATDLEPGAANDARTFVVEANGNRTVEPELAIYDLGLGHVTLFLPPNALQAGDRVQVFWDDLGDRRGRALSGRSGTFVARWVQ
jgi:hypothetical protein